MYDRDVRPFGYSFVGFHFLPEILDRLIFGSRGLDRATPPILPLEVDPKVLPIL